MVNALFKIDRTPWAFLCCDTPFIIASSVSTSVFVHLTMVCAFAA